MKKLALVLCTVMAICCAGSAFAATVDKSVTDSRNGNNTLQENVAEKTSMPCFRAGDTLNFKVTDLSSGSQLTIISYKAGDGVDIGNETVQYIDQRTISDDVTEDTIKYVIRDIKEGIYKVSVKSSNDNIYSLYYKVGTPKVDTVKQTGKNYFIEQNNNDGTYSIGFVGRADMGSKDVSFADAGVKSFGFDYGDNYIKYLTDDQMKTLYEETDKKIANGEISGSYSVYFVQTIYSILANEIDDAKKITATAVMTDTTSESNTAE